jgi:hypothetical protein
LGNIANLENRRQTGGSFNRFDRELYNEIEKSIQAGFQRKSKDSKLEIWMKPTMI